MKKYYIFEDNRGEIHVVFDHLNRKDDPWTGSVLPADYYGERKYLELIEEGEIESIHDLETIVESWRQRNRAEIILDMIIELYRCGHIKPHYIIGRLPTQQLKRLYGAVERDKADYPEFERIYLSYLANEILNEIVRRRREDHE